MPAEWEYHSAVYLSWPYDTTTFPNLDKVEQSYLQWIKELTAEGENEHLFLFIRGVEQKERVASLLRAKGVNLHKITFWLHNYTDVWIRDYGPTFIVNKEIGSLAMVHWKFNAWGEKYKEIICDGQTPSRIEKRFGYRCFSPNIVMEGGALEVDGTGTLLTTKQCLLNQNRNPHLSCEQIEEILKSHIGVSKILWLDEGIEGDDTDGHIDDIARFTDSRTIVACWEKDTALPNHKVLRENFQYLCHMSNVENRPYRVVKLPMPSPIYDRGDVLPASYANFYIANKTVCVPIFNDKNDKIALKILQELFPNRKVVGIMARDFIFGRGTLHCASQQQPSFTFDILPPLKKGVFQRER